MSNLKKVLYFLCVAFIVIHSLLSLSSCSTTKLVDSIEPRIEADAVFNYSQKFVAKYVACGIGDNYDTIRRYDQCVKRIKNKNGKNHKGLIIPLDTNYVKGLNIFDDGGSACISWHGDNVDIYTVKGVAEKVTIHHEERWIIYWSE
jgi:hypothetical protein